MLPRRCRAVQQAHVESLSCSGNCIWPKPCAEWQDRHALFENEIIDKILVKMDVQRREILRDSDMLSRGNSAVKLLRSEPVSRLA